MDAILDDPVRGPMIAAVDILGWVYRADGGLFATRGAINRAPREQRPDIATPEELEALKKKLGVDATDQRDFLNGPEFQRLFDTLWASSKPMKYRAWREYRDARPNLVLLWNDDEYPRVTSAVERQVPANVRAATRPADLVRSNQDTAWCMARPGQTYLVYTMAGRVVSLDLSKAGGSYSVTWIDESGGPARDIPPDRFCRSNRDARATRRVGRQAVGRVAIANGCMNGVHDMRRCIIVSVLALAGLSWIASGSLDGATRRTRPGSPEPDRRPAVPHGPRGASAYPVAQRPHHRPRRAR